MISPLWSLVKTNNPKIKNSKSFFVNEDKNKTLCTYIDCFYLILFNDGEWLTASFSSGFVFQIWHFTNSVINNGRYLHSKVKLFRSGAFVNKDICHVVNARYSICERSWQSVAICNVRAICLSICVGILNIFHSKGLKLENIDYSDLIIKLEVITHLFGIDSLYNLKSTITL